MPAEVAVRNLSQILLQLGHHAFGNRLIELIL
jgi:hypothetical protein